MLDLQPPRHTSTLPLVSYNNQMHVCYRDSSSIIWDAWYDGSGHWNLQRLTVGAALTSGPAAASDPDVVSYNTAGSPTTATSIRRSCVRP